MKRLLIFFLLLSFDKVSAQWTSMQRYEEFGQGNFFAFVDRESDAKRIIQETLTDNLFSHDVPFYKGSNLLTNISITDPLNSEYVYIVHCLKGKYHGKMGYQIFCYYMENRFRYFYDVTEDDGRISILYDPNIFNVSPNGRTNKNK